MTYYQKKRDTGWHKSWSNIMKEKHYAITELDPINAYRQGLLTPDEFRGFCKGNVIKYLYRYEEKGGVEDLKKARNYINELISLFEREKK